MGRGGNTQSLTGDGITISGRLTGFLGVFVLLFFTVANFTPTWSYSEALSVGGGLDSISEATFGLREYCLKTHTSTFVDPQMVCTVYEDQINIRTTNASSPAAATAMVPGEQICGEAKADFLANQAAGVAVPADLYSWTNQTGCDRFAGACDFASFHSIRVVLVAAILFAIAGATFSEKIPFYGAMLLVSMLFSIAAIGVWAKWASDLDSELTPDIGLGIMAGATVAALLGAILAFVNTCVDTERNGLMDDGIDCFGRMGSLMTVATWLFLAIALVMPTWTEVTNLGDVGGLCNDDCLYADCTEMTASFGLLRYCVDTTVTLTGNTKKERVCFFYSDEVAVVGNGSTLTGFQRFESQGLESTVDWTTFLMSVGIASSAFADIFSEKLVPAAILSLLTSICGVISLSWWLSFQSDLDDAIPGDAESSDGVYVVGTAFAIGLMTSIVYTINACKYYHDGDESDA